MSENAIADFKMFDLRGVDWPEASNRSLSGVRVTPETALQCSAFLACVRVISESVASLPLHLYQRLADGGKAKADAVPLYRLLHDTPNSWQTGLEFREQMTALYLMYGNSFAEIRPGVAGAVSELWPLHPSRMEVERLENGSLRYKYREPNGRQTIYSQEQIFHLRWLTTDGVVGLQPSTLSRNAIGLAQALEAHGSTYFGNGARPGIVLESDNPIPAEAAERLREQWERMHRGADRAFRTAVLPNGVKAHELSGSNEAAQFLETRQYQVIEVCRAFRVPPHMIQDLTRSTYSNIEVQGTEFVQHCLLPHLKRWEAAISRDLINGADLFAEHSVTGLLRGDSVARASYYREMLNLGVLSINEIRELENLNPIGPEGDQRFMQMNMTTLDKVGQEPPAPEPMPAPVAEVEDSPEDDTEDQAEQESQRSQQRNCGTGAGGFQPGNKCSGGGDGGSGDSGGSGGGSGDSGSASDSGGLGASYKAGGPLDSSLSPKPGSVQKDSIDKTALRWAGGSSHGFIDDGATYRVFHGTDSSNVKSISGSVLRPPAGKEDSAQWYMLSTSMDVASDFSRGQDKSGAFSVIEYRIPAADLKSVLWKGQEMHGGDVQHAVRGDGLSAKYLHAVHKAGQARS